MITDRQLAAQGRAMQREAWGMDGRKEAIIDALRAFIEQRPGFEFCNYSTMRDYRQDQRRAERHLHDARVLLDAVSSNDAITADALLKAAEGDRLSIALVEEFKKPSASDDAIYYARQACGGIAERPPLGKRMVARIDYCTGQYFPVEFRAGVCRVLSSALWDWQREHMPPAFAPPCCVNKDQHAFRKPDGLMYPMSAGDWLRATFRQRFGKGLQSRWFD